MQNNDNAINIEITKQKINNYNETFDQGAEGGKVYEIKLPGKKIQDIEKYKIKMQTVKIEGLTFKYCKCTLIDKDEKVVKELYIDGKEQTTKNTKYQQGNKQENMIIENDDINEIVDLLEKEKIANFDNKNINIKYNYYSLFDKNDEQAKSIECQNYEKYKKNRYIFLEENQLKCPTNIIKDKLEKAALGVISSVVINQSKKIANSCYIGLDAIKDIFKCK